MDQADKGEKGRPMSREAQGSFSRRRLLRLALYVAPAMLVLDVAGSSRALAQSPGATLEWPGEEEYGGPFPQE